MIPEHSPATDDEHQVLPFRRRGAPAIGSTARSLPQPKAQAEPAADFAKYEGGTLEDNYRHRMMVNLAALAFTILLAVAGAWLAITIADMRKSQDCYLSGRKNCTPIEPQSLPGR